MANANVRLELNHDGIEQIEDSFAEVALQHAESICARANAMRARASEAEFNVGLRGGRKGGRRYAVVSADAPSVIHDNAKNNILAKAMG